MRNAEITHQTTTIDPERATPIRPIRTATEIRQALTTIQTTARRILSGDYDSRPISPRQIRLYGRTVPMHVALSAQVGYLRTTELGQRLRYITPGDELDSWRQIKERKIRESRQARRRWVRR